MPSSTIYHRMKNLNARMMANYKRGFGPTRVVMLLTTTGRKSGLPRATPLQYEEVDGDYYIVSARGTEADWFKNIVADPNVHVQVRDREIDAVAEPVTDPLRIADFIELRLRRRPHDPYHHASVRWLTPALQSCRSGTILQRESDGGFAPKAG